MSTISISLKIDLIILITVFRNSKICTLSINLMVIILLLRQLQKTIVNRVKLNIQLFINFKIVFISNHNKISVNRFSSTITTTDFFKHKLNEINYSKINTINFGNNSPPLSKLLFKRQTIETSLIRNFTDLTNLISLINLFDKITIQSEIIIERTIFSSKIFNNSIT